jgi:hypothetical protein
VNSANRLQGLPQNVRLQTAARSNEVWLGTGHSELWLPAKIDAWPQISPASQIRQVRHEH